MPTLVWIVLGFGVWTMCGLLAVAVACAASRGDRHSTPAAMGMDPSVELAPRRRMVVDVTPVARPWVAAGPASSVASVLVEAGGPTA
jgi:hypothetical protein